MQTRFWDVDGTCHVVLENCAVCHVDDRQHLPLITFSLIGILKLERMGCWDLPQFMGKRLGTAHYYSVNISTF